MKCCFPKAGKSTSKSIQNPTLLKQQVENLKGYYKDKPSKLESEIKTLENHIQATEKVLSQLTIPVLILSGSEDKVVPLHFQEELHHLIKKSELKVIVGGYHRVPIQKPEEMCAVLLQFIEHHTFHQKQNKKKK